MVVPKYIDIGKYIFSESVFQLLYIFSDRMYAHHFLIYIGILVTEYTGMNSDHLFVVEKGMEIGKVSSGTKGLKVSEYSLMIIYLYSLAYLKLFLSTNLQSKRGMDGRRYFSNIPW